MQAQEDVNKFKEKFVYVFEGVLINAPTQGMSLESAAPGGPPLRKRSRRSAANNQSPKCFSVEFPNLETLNWIAEQIRFIGQLQWQDTRLGEARHNNAKNHKRLTNNHNDARDILRLVCGCFLTQYLLMACHLPMESDGTDTDASVKPGRSL